jgi:hypothetical protein
VKSSPGILVASLGTAVMALLLVALAIASLASGHGSFSGVIGVAVACYGLGLAVAAWGLLRGIGFARGPVIACGLLNLVTAVSLAAAAPLAWLVAALAAATVVAAALPSTSDGLRWRAGRTGSED